MFVTEEIKNSILALADQNNGQLQAEQVVAAASDLSHPAHDLFEWDDAKAAAAQRLSTARVLIRTIRITVETIELTGPKRVPAFAQHPSGGYATLNSLRSDPGMQRERQPSPNVRSMRRQALRRARQSWRIELWPGGRCRGNARDLD